MKTKRDIVQVEEAIARIRPHIRLGNTEEVPLLDSIGRRLAENVRATHDLPPFRRSGMDGYAIRSADSAGATSDNPLLLNVIETIPCGEVSQKDLVPGTASRIMTGAMLPEGADAVVMFELTREEEWEGDRYIALRQPVQAGHNVTPVGFEAKRDTPMLERGRVIGPGEVALLATFGYARVNVYKKPTVAILTTGSELLGVDEPLLPGKIRDSNRYLLAAQVLQAGGVPVMVDTLPDDDIEGARSKIRQAFYEADLLITTGGVSVGDYDLLTDIFQAWEGDTLFSKVAMRPGKHTTAGVWQGKFWFGLSGNPGACFVGFELFVQPVLWGMQGKRDLVPASCTAKLGRVYGKGSPFPRYARGYLTEENGCMTAWPVGMDQSSITASIAEANCLIRIPAGQNPVQTGDDVQVIKLSVRV